MPAVLAWAAFPRQAASTYLDLLAARTSEALAQEPEKELHDLVEQTKKLAAVEPGAKVEAARVQAELHGRQQTIRKLQQQAAVASARLVYLLGLDPCTELMPVDQLVPFELVDASPPACDLVTQALAHGPGMREMQGLLALIHESVARAQGPSRLLPAFGIYMAEGGFGAGPGSQLDWEDRWDLGLHARWNLTELMGRRTAQEMVQSQLSQVHLAYEDLRGKLVAGVQEARETILSGQEQIRSSEEQIRHARQALELSKERLQNNVPGSSPGEVLLSLQFLALAQLSYIEAVRAYDKAQLQLLLLLKPCPTTNAE